MQNEKKNKQKIEQEEGLLQQSGSVENVAQGKSEGVQERKIVSKEKMEAEVSPFAPGDKPLDMESIPVDLGKLLETLKIMSMEMQTMVRVINGQIDYIVLLRKTIENEIQEQLERDSVR